MVVAEDRYQAEDALRGVLVEYQELPPVVDVEKAAEEGAPILHPKVGTNIINQRQLRYGDTETAFAQADVVVGRQSFLSQILFHPSGDLCRDCGIRCHGGRLHRLVQFSGAFHHASGIGHGSEGSGQSASFHHPCRYWRGFGIKTSMFPQIVMTALTAKKVGVPVKYLEDRMEHLMSSSSGTDRVTTIELAAKKDGTILGVRKKVLDNVGAYLRSPEPACMYRGTGNQLGPYTIKNLAWDAYVIMSNKSPTGPNRGYGCQQLYFEPGAGGGSSRPKLGMDPAELRRKTSSSRNSSHTMQPPGGYTMPATIRGVLTWR